MMRTLPYNFVIFKYCGLWRPVHWPPGWKTKLYDTYTVFMLFGLFTAVLSELIGLVTSDNDVNTFTSNTFMLLSVIAVCGKAINVLMKRNTIIELIDSLQNFSSLPRCSEEAEIQNKFDTIARFNVLCYGGLIEATLVAVVVGSLIEVVPLRKLPYISWLPFNHNTSAIGYSVAWIHQVGCIAVASNINIAFDTLVPWFMMQTCSQLNILKYRIDMIPRNLDGEGDRQAEHTMTRTTFLETVIVEDCVKHHRKIFKFANATIDLFGLIIFIQYTISSVVLCITIFQLSKMGTLNHEFAAAFLYLACLIVEIFQFCFYGNEVTFESVSVSDGIYQMDWTALSTETKRSLIVLIIRSQRPIVYISFSLITLNLDSFTTLIKLSYSAYNVLQQSSK